MAKQGSADLLNAGLGYLKEQAQQVNKQTSEDKWNVRPTDVTRPVSGTRK